MLVDAVSGLLIFEITRPANITDSEVAIPLLKERCKIHGFSLKETDFIADKGYDTKEIYNLVHDGLQVHAFIPLNLAEQRRKISLLLVTSFVMPVLQCIKMVASIILTGSSKNLHALLKIAKTMKPDKLMKKTA